MVVLIILAISAGPRMRMLYEQKVEKSLTEFSDVGGDADPGAAAQLARGNVAAGPETAASLARTRRAQTVGVTIFLQPKRPETTRTTHRSSKLALRKRGASISRPIALTTFERRS